MAYVETSTMKNATIMLLHAERNEIELNPEYQRMGGIWTLAKQRLLIDSILNDYDIPKLYFHYLSDEIYSSSGKRYSVIDGRQRLEAIWNFMDGKFTLASDFDYQRDPDVQMSSFSYQDIATRYPKIRIKFDSFVLPVVVVQVAGDDLDLIEDMFSRLNEAVPLNAAEKRNAFGGKFVAAVNALSTHKYFLENVRFSSSRYKHREVIARFLLIEDSIRSSKKIIDTKREYLDGIANRLKDDRLGIVDDLMKAVVGVLDFMCNLFTPKDELLLAQGTQVVYYLICRTAIKSGQAAKIDRPKILAFRRSLFENREVAVTDYEKAKFELLEFDRLSQQGTNDANSIKERYNTLCNALGLIPDSDIVGS